MKKKRTKKTAQKTLGHEVRKARKAVKMTQSELADKVNMKVGYISDLEEEKIARPPADLLYKIALALGTTIADLCGLPVRVRKEGA